MIARIDPTSVSDYHFNSLGAITRWIQYYTNYTLATMGEFQILLGILIGMYSIVSYGARKLQKIYEILGKRTQNDYKNMWAESYKKIYFGFYEELINRMNKILTRYDDVVVYCHLVTMNQFKYYFKDDLKQDTMQEMLSNLRLELDEKGIPQIADQKFVEEQKQKSQEQAMMDMSKFSGDARKTVGTSINEKISKMFDIDISVIQAGSVGGDERPGGVSKILDDSLMNLKSDLNLEIQNREAQKAKKPVLQLDSSMASKKKPPSNKEKGQDDSKISGAGKNPAPISQRDKSIEKKGDTSKVSKKSAGNNKSKVSEGKKSSSKDRSKSKGKSSKK